MTPAEYKALSVRTYAVTKWIGFAALCDWCLVGLERLTGVFDSLTQWSGALPAMLLAVGLILTGVWLLEVVRIRLVEVPVTPITPPAPSTAGKRSATNNYASMTQAFDRSALD